MMPSGKGSRTQRVRAMALILAGCVTCRLALPLGAAGGALQFDGANDYVTFGPAPGLGVSALTLETWVKRTGAGLTSSSGSGGVVAVPLITKGRGEADGSNVDCNYFLGLQANTFVLAADFEEGIGGVSLGLNHPITGLTPLAIGVWYHVAATYDGTTWALYLNGVLETSLDVGRPMRFDSIQHAALGAALQSTGAPEGAFAGILDEVRIWNYARSAAQIASNRLLQISSAPGLIGRWALDEGSGLTAGGTGSSGVNGALVNGPAWVAGYPFQDPIVWLTTPNAHLTRGPYLQRQTPTSAMVCWRTDGATDGRVRYGLDPGLLTNTATELLVANDHFVLLSGLEPERRYYYSVGTAEVPLAGSTNYFLVTAPLPGTNRPVRAWVLGDPGTKDANQRAVRDAYDNFTTNTPRSDLVLLLGDNAYQSGTDTEYQAALFDMYTNVLRNTPIWSCIGNHDTAQSATPAADIPYFKMFAFPANAEAGGAASGTEKYYSFDFANVHFICLDSMSSARTATGPMANWLTADLASTTQKWMVAFWHHPAYSKGSHDSDTEIELKEMRQNIVPILESYGVDLSLVGHSHNYERSMLIDGHYGLSTTFAASMKVDPGNGRTNGTGPYLKPDSVTTHRGSVYCTAGTSGQAGGGTLNHPVMVMSANILGSVVLDVSGDRLDLKFLTAAGAIQDYFTILKGGSAVPPSVPANLVATVTGTNQIQLTWVNTASNAASLRLERSLDGVNFSMLTLLATNVSSSANTGLAFSTTYFYRLRAENEAGSSAWTPVASRTTPAPPLVTVGGFGPLFQGIDHAVGTNFASGFGDQVVHILRVDLQDTNIQFLATPPMAAPVFGSRETAGETTTEFLTNQNLQAAINANYFSPCCGQGSGTAMELMGLAISRGQLVSPQDTPDFSSALLLDSNNIPAILHTNWPATNNAGVFNAVTGRYPLVIGGVNVGTNSTINPRTAIGYSQDRRYLILLTIDGRQAGYSDGAADIDTAAWMLRYGATEALNLDGGGSTTMAIADGHGGATLLNRPIHNGIPGTQRVVGNNLGIYARAFAPAGIASQPQNQLVTVGGTATFSVIATGSPPFFYQWRFNSADIAGATNATLNIAGVADAHAGTYAVRLGNTNSILSANAVLAVNHPPVAGTFAAQRPTACGVKFPGDLLLGIDPDGDATVLASAGPGTASGGSVTRLGRWVIYAPPAGNSNADSFSYSISDGRGATTGGSVNIGVVADSAPSQNVTVDDLGTGSFRLRCSGIPGRPYSIQFSNDPGNPVWQPLATVTADAQGVFEHLDTPPPGLSRFYRTIQP